MAAEIYLHIPKTAGKIGGQGTATTAPAPAHPYRTGANMANGTDLLRRLQEAKRRLALYVLTRALAYTRKHLAAAEAALAEAERNQ